MLSLLRFIIKESASCIIEKEKEKKNDPRKKEFEKYLSEMVLNQTVPRYVLRSREEHYEEQYKREELYYRQQQVCAKKERNVIGRVVDSHNRLGSLHVCVVCHDREVDCVTLPCRHAVMCVKCAEKRMTTCPICESIIALKIPLKLKHSTSSVWHPTR